jgi:outer membrane cobalamin receptor
MKQIIYLFILLSGAAVEAQQATDTTAVDSLPLAELVITATRSLQPVTQLPGRSSVETGIHP